MRIVQMWIGDTMPRIIQECIESTKRVWDGVPYHLETSPVSGCEHLPNARQSDIYRIRTLANDPETFWIDADVMWYDRPFVCNTYLCTGSISRHHPDSYMIYGAGMAHLLSEMRENMENLLKRNRFPKGRTTAHKRLYARYLKNSNRFDKCSYKHLKFTKKKGMLYEAG